MISFPISSQWNSDGCETPDICPRNGFSKLVPDASFRAPGLACPSGSHQPFLSHESSLIPRLRQAPPRRLPSREAQRHRLRDLQVEPQVQGPPRCDRRNPPLEEGSVSHVPHRGAEAKILKRAASGLLSCPGGEVFEHPAGGDHAEGGRHMSGGAKAGTAVQALACVSGRFLS